MPAFNVGVNSTFEQQRQIINAIAVDTFALSTTLSGITSDGLVVTYSEESGVSTVSGYANIAGVATYATNAGVSTYASFAGVSTYAGLAGVATYAASAGVATNADYATIAGSAAFATVAAAATNASYATQAGEAAFAPYAGISTYATTAGVATNAQGLTGAPNVIVGVITGGLFVGDGSELTGINVGVSTFADVAGFATAAGSAGTADYALVAGISTVAQNLAGTPNLNVGVLTATSVNLSELSLTGVVTASSFRPVSGYIQSPDGQQAIQLYSGSGAVNFPNGIGTDLTVAGRIYGDASNVTGIVTAGISSIVPGGNVIIEQTGNVAIVTAIFSGSATGYFEGNATGIHTLSNIGIGTTTAEFPLTVLGAANIPTITGVTTFNDVVRLGYASYLRYGARKSVFEAQTNPLLEVHASNDTDYAYKMLCWDTTGNTSDWLVHDLAANMSVNYNMNVTGEFVIGQDSLLPTTLSEYSFYVDIDGPTNLYYNKVKKLETYTDGVVVSGIVSATSFTGTVPSSNLSGALPALDGSALTGVSAVGSGVEVRDSDSPVGAAATINFGNNLSVVLSAGIATVTGSNTASFATNAGGLTGQPSIIVSDITSDGQYTGFTSMTGEANHFFTMRTNGDTGAVVGINTKPANDSEGFGTLVLDGAYYFPGDIKGGGKIEMKNMGRDYLQTSCWDSVGLTSFIGYSQATQTYLWKPYLYRAAGSGQALIGITTLGNIGIATLTPTTTLDVFGDAKVSGVLTATSFSGSLAASNLTGALPAIDGSNLLNVTAAGTGVNIQDDGVGVGAAATVINFASGLNVVASAGIATVTGSGGGAQSRTIVSGVTTSIANLGIGNTDIIGQKSYALMKVGLSTAGWIRLYTDSTSRSNDVSRSVGEDPAPGSGVIAEVVTTGISTQQIITPFAMGGNMDEPVTNKIYVAIQNLSGSTQTITANLTILQLEA